MSFEKCCNFFPNNYKFSIYLNLYTYCQIKNFHDNFFFNLFTPCNADYRAWSYKKKEKKKIKAYMKSL